MNDMWGLGYMMFAILMREFIFTEQSKNIHDHRSLNKNVTEVIKKKTDGRLSDEGLYFMSKLLEYNPKKRFRLSNLDPDHKDFNKRLKK